MNAVERVKPIKFAKPAASQIAMPGLKQFPRIASAISMIIPVHSSCLEVMQHIRFRSHTNLEAQKEIKTIENLHDILGLPPAICEIFKSSLNVKVLVLAGEKGSVEVPVLCSKNAQFSGASEVKLIVDGEEQPYSLAKMDSELSAKDVNAGLCLKGKPVAPGYRYGDAYLWAQWERGAGIVKKKIDAAAVKEETERLDKAFKNAIVHYRIIKEEVMKQGEPLLAESIDASLLLLNTEMDNFLFNEMKNIIEGKGYISKRSSDVEAVAIVEAGNHWNAEYAVEIVINNAKERFAAMHSLEFMKYENDLEDIGKIILGFLSKSDGVTADISVDGARKLSRLPENSENVAIVAESIGISDMGPIFHAKAKVRSLVMAEGGAVSHAAIILARVLDVPCVTGLGEKISTIHEGDKLYVDGVHGNVFVNPDVQSSEIIQFMERRTNYNYYVESIKKSMQAKTYSRDGIEFNITSIIGSAEELPIFFSYTKDNSGKNGGIGLVRTEVDILPMLEKNNIPDREIFAKWYGDMAKAMHERSRQGEILPNSPLPLNFRLYDFGGDKNHNGTDTRYAIPASLNPFLGIRGVRLYQYSEAWRKLFTDQLYGILYSSQFNPLVSAMIPMISVAEEFEWAKEEFEGVKTNMRSEGVPFNEGLKFGAMIETPAAAHRFVSTRLAQVADFFSWGSNDFVQYFMAADRGDNSVSYLHDPFHPVIIEELRELKSTIDRKNGTPKTAASFKSCGNIGADPLFLIILAGLGIREISVTPSEKPKVEHLIGGISVENCRNIVDEYTGTFYGIKGKDSKEKFRHLVRRSIGIEAWERIEAMQKVAAGG